LLKYSHNVMKNVIITGGTGLVGNHLSKKLRKLGYRVYIFSSSVNHESDYIYYWNYEKGIINHDILKDVDYIIHLAGANISSGRWTLKRKKELVDSRVNSAEFLFNKIKENNVSLKAFISASAVGYYGAVTGDKVFGEDDIPTDDFLGNTCKLWEAAADKFSDLGIRTVKLRTGIVLTSEGGALSKMKTPIKLGFGSAIGTGKQYMPWIHIDDLCNIYIKAIEDDNMKGAYNAVAPSFSTNKEFTQIFAKALNKPFWFPLIPSFFMRLIFGEMSDILLKGSRISSDKITNAGYEFKYDKLKKALESFNF